MAGSDFTISAQVRRQLVRRWVRAESLEVGVTEGVVLLRGSLVLEAGGAIDLADLTARSRFLRRLRGDLLSLQGVRDVVMDLRQTGGEREAWLSHAK